MTHLGCYGDTSSRTMVDLDGSHALLSEAYQQRSDAVLKCYYVSRWGNYRVIIILHYMLYHISHTILITIIRIVIILIIIIIMLRIRLPWSSVMADPDMEYIQERFFRFNEVVAP